MKKKILDKLLKSLRKVYKNKNEYYSLHNTNINKQDEKVVNSCLKNKIISTVDGPYIKEFEKKIKTLTKSKFVVCTISGTSALHISLKLLGVKRGDEVLVPSFNFIASVNAILYNGAIPHFIDSDDRMGVNPNELDNYLKKNTIFKNGKCLNKKTKNFISVFIPTYSYGHGLKIVDLIKVCKKYKIEVLEDSSEALGTYPYKKHAGTFAKVGVLSFNGNKIITSSSGGAILTSSKKFANLANHLVKTAKKIKNDSKIHTQLGYNYRITNMNAALGLSQINRIKNILDLKRKLKVKLSRSIKEINEYFEIFDEPVDCKSNYWIQLLVIKKIFSANEIIKFLNKNNIQCQSCWMPVDKFKYLRNYPKMKLKNSTLYRKKFILLPSNTF